MSSTLVTGPSRLQVAIFIAEHGAAVPWEYYETRFPGVPAVRLYKYVGAADKDAERVKCCDLLTEEYVDEYTAALTEWLAAVRLNRTRASPPNGIGDGVGFATALAACAATGGAAAGGAGAGRPVVVVALALPFPLPLLPFSPPVPLQLLLPVVVSLAGCVSSMVLVVVRPLLLLPPLLPLLALLALLLPPPPLLLSLAPLATPLLGLPSPVVEPASLPVVALFRVSLRAPSCNVPPLPFFTLLAVQMGSSLVYPVAPAPAAAMHAHPELVALKNEVVNAVYLGALSPGFPEHLRQSLPNLLCQHALWLVCGRHLCHLFPGLTSSLARDHLFPAMVTLLDRPPPAAAVPVIGVEGSDTKDKDEGENDDADKDEEEEGKEEEEEHGEEEGDFSDSY
ncbi:hypothetical protein DFH27DRAFT_609594 [Peziza echinospora]|nr:hypothetical protein DFH27DRAFT_609594 [Peziza echinospora]